MEKQLALSTIIAANFGQQVAFLQRLVQANSANPYTPEASAPDAPVEKEVAAVTHQELQRCACLWDRLLSTLVRLQEGCITRDDIATVGSLGIHQGSQQAPGFQFYLLSVLGPLRCRFLLAMGHFVRLRPASSEAAV